MEILTKENLEKHFTQLDALANEELETLRDNCIDMLQDEMKSFIEHIFFGGKPCAGTLDTQARLDYALANAKFVGAEIARRLNRKG